MIWNVSTPTPRDRPFLAKVQGMKEPIVLFWHVEDPESMIRHLFTRCPGGMMKRIRNAVILEWTEATYADCAPHLPVAGETQERRLIVAKLPLTALRAKLTDLICETAMAKPGSKRQQKLLQRQSETRAAILEQEKLESPQIVAYRSGEYDTAEGLLKDYSAHFEEVDENTALTGAFASDPSDEEREMLELMIGECSEIIQEASKVMRYGWNSHHPAEPHVSNKDRLNREVLDLRAVLWAMNRDGHIDSEDEREVIRRWRRKLPWCRHQ